MTTTHFKVIENLDQGNNLHTIHLKEILPLSRHLHLRTLPSELARLILHVKPNENQEANTSSTQLKTHDQTVVTNDTINKTTRKHRRNSGQSSSFVTVQNGRLILNNRDYLYVGTNFWYGANLASLGLGGDRERLLRELNHLHSLGIDNLRIQAGSEGPNSEPWRIVPSMQPEPGSYDESVLDGLDFLLYEMGKRQMRAIMCLNNFWHWSGGFAQYIVWAGGASSIPYPGDYNVFELFSARFYELPRAVELFNNHIQFIMKRTNKYNNISYTEDPTIMSWELANEPRRLDLAWVNHTACLIKQLAPKQLVTTGVEGNISSKNFSNDHASPCIDYATFHLWVQNWNIYNPQNASVTLPIAMDFAQKYIDFHAAYKDKPVVLEEFGISRDNDDHSPTASISVRDKYYQFIFQSARDHRIPVNFWAYGGEGRPRFPRANWTQGDDFIGDPPHEPQGWYSVYDTDQSTLDIIHQFTSMNSAASATTIVSFTFLLSLVITSFM